MLQVSSKVLAFAAIIGIAFTSPFAQADTWYSRLVGAADDGAQNQLHVNGFDQVDSFESGRDGYGAIWYNRSSGQCLQVITVNGRVDSAGDIQSHPRCNR